MLKRKVYADIPEFDQETQAIFQKAPVDMGDYELCDVEIVDLPPQEEGEDEEWL
jgi:hypothetical protein